MANLTFACVMSVITNNSLQALSRTNGSLSADKMPRQHEKSKTEGKEANFSSTSDCAAPLIFFSRSAPLRPASKNQNTNNIVRGMAHRNGERVALGALIGLFRAKGRKGSPIARGYLHTNSIMVIRDAPLEALEVCHALFPVCSFVPIIFCWRREWISESARESRSLALFRGRSSACGYQPEKLVPLEKKRIATCIYGPPVVGYFARRSPKTRLRLYLRRRLFPALGWLVWIFYVDRS